jgi:MoeA C-terminal region (domain IV)
MDSAAAMHPQVDVLVESNLQLDPERPEYHRAILSTAGEGGVVTARSTGNQRSSRLLSMSSSNALLCLPQGTGTIAAGTKVTAIITGPLTAPKASVSYHASAACVDCPDALSNQSPPPPSIVEKPAPSRQPYKMRVGLLTISDRVSDLYHGQIYRLQVLSLKFNVVLGVRL